MNLILESLVVGCFLHKLAEDEFLLPADDVPPQLVHDEDDEGEGQGWEPPARVQRVQAYVLRYYRNVDEEDGQHRLEDEGEVERVVVHLLCEDGDCPRLADDEVRPLNLLTVASQYIYIYIICWSIQL